MGLFDKARNLVKNIFGGAAKAPKAAEPKIPKGIESAWSGTAEPAGKPSFFDRVKDGAKSLFKKPKAEAKAPSSKAPSSKAPRSKAPSAGAKEVTTPFPTQSAQPFEAPPTPRHFKETEPGKRQEEIFRFRRNTQEEGNAFYRLTQSIWDRPDVPASRRDEAIRDYFERKYGISDMNEIYDFVLEKYRDIIERYRNSPNAMKYEIIKNIKVANAEL